MVTAPSRQAERGLWTTAAAGCIIAIGALIATTPDRPPSRTSPGGRRAPHLPPKENFPISHSPVKLGALRGIFAQKL